MAYLGRQPIIGNYQVLDALTASATATYALTKNSVAVFPQTPANCIVSLNGVIQAPFDSYTISGSNIVFASALTGSDSIDFITVLGDVLNIGTPSDNTVSLAKLTATGTKDATTFLRGDNTFASAGGTNTPAFSVYASTGVSSIVSGTQTLVPFNTENYDTDNAFDNTSGNYKFTVPIGKDGKYFFQASVLVGGQANNDLWIVRTQLRKNGSVVFKPEFRFAQGSANGEEVHSFNGQVQGCLDLTAGDYIQIYSETYGKTSGYNISSGQSSVWFTGFKLI